MSKSIIALAAAVIIIILSFSAANAATYVGCDVWYTTYSIPAPTTGYSKSDVCQYGICNWYHVPECGQNCYVEICFASENPDESAPSCRATTDPGAVDIHCRLSKSFPIRNRHNSGMSAAFVCDLSGCSLYCVTTQSSTVQDIFDDWNNSNWVMTGSRTWRCNCDTGNCEVP